MPKAAAGGGLSRKELESSYALGAKLSEIIGLTPAAMVNRSFEVLDDEIDALSDEEEKADLQEARDIWRTKWETAPKNGSGIKADLVFVTGDGRKMRAVHLKRSLDALQDKQAKTAAGGGLSKKKLESRNALGAELREIIGLTPAAMVNLNFTSLKNKIDALSDPRKKADLQAARDAWRAKWETAPKNGGGIKADLVFVTPSGEKMRADHLENALNVWQNRQAEIAAGGGLSQEALHGEVSYE